VRVPAGSGRIRIPRALGQPAGGVWRREAGEDSDGSSACPAGAIWPAIDLDEWIAAVTRLAAKSGVEMRRSLADSCL
jgi:hypothetical protein